MQSPSETTYNTGVGKPAEPLSINNQPATIIAHASAIVAARICENAEISPVTLFNLDVNAIARGEVWRLVTPLVSTVPWERPWNTMVTLSELFPFGARLQDERFRGSAADYTWFLLTTGLVQVGVAATLMPRGRTLVQMGCPDRISCLVEAPVAGIVHLWSQTTTDEHVTLGTIFTVPARYLTPVVVAVRVFLMHNSAHTLILGAMAAHAFHELSNDARTETWLRAPAWLRRVLGEDADQGDRGGGGGLWRAWGTGQRSGGR